MISLKKSFEYKNYFKNLFNECCSLLIDDSFMTKTIEEHYINKVNKDEDDKVENIISLKRNIYSFITPNQLIDFVIYINNECNRLSEAITAAKTREPLSRYDTLITKNSQDRDLLYSISATNKIKSKEEFSVGSGRKFNIDGEQVTYDYDVKRIKTIDFDRNETKKLALKLRSECNSTSEAIDLLLVQNLVEFDTIFETGESFEEAFERYLNK